MKPIASIVVFLLLTFNGIAQHEKFSFDKNWRFHKGDVPIEFTPTHDNSYINAKAGTAWGAANPAYNDSSWRLLQLPHDWAVENPFDSTQNISQGYKERGFGWYRKTFSLPEADRGKHLEIQFEGIATFATIWFNGNIVHRNWCGYTSFYVDITSMAKYGKETNSIVVKVDANGTNMEGWWYEGAGIYRHTWLIKRNPLHIITNGVYANPVKQNNQWKIPVEVTLNNSGNTAGTVQVSSVLIDASGKQMANGTTSTTILPLKNNLAKYELSIANPTLWTLENPTLYKVITTVSKDGKVIDELTTRCGFRTFRFDKNTGFYLNDKHVKIKGVCNHQDHAGVGTAIPGAIWDFRMEKLKEMGANAYRCSHNPPPTKLLELCDSLGILVMDENRNFNVSPEYEAQLKWMLQRDRNHPSIILWSVFNEEPIQYSTQGYEMVRRMNHIVKSYDTTRPVTAAMNGGFFTPLNVSDAVDVVGFNYNISAYDPYRKAHPNKVLTSSEDISAFQTRGEYKTDKSKNIIDSYDTWGADWGSTQRHGWKEIDTRPWLAGSFIWTGFDYRGEPTPFKWPSVSSYFGLMDLCGFPKMAYWLKQAQWKQDANVLQVVPHWNWPKDSIGKKIKVMALSNADSVVMLLNGKKMGGQKVDKYEMNTWYIPYTAGKLEAIGYKNGKVISNFKTETTGEPVALKLEPYKNILLNDGLDAIPITVKALDAKGREVPTANMLVKFSINKNAAIIGVGNGNPTSHEADKASQRKLFNGLAQVIIQSNEGAEGMVELRATAEGMKPASIFIPIKNVPAIPAW